MIFAKLLISNLFRVDSSKDRPSVRYANFLFKVSSINSEQTKKIIEF